MDMDAKKPCDLPWAESHGANSEWLGAGLIYDMAIRLTRARVAVIVGSGGGFVPRVCHHAMAQGGVCILVDAGLGDVGFGSPYCEGGVYSTSGMLSRDGQIVLKALSSTAAQALHNVQLRPSYVHLDADHSFRGVKSDILDYWTLLQPGGIMTIHDTGLRAVQHAIAECRELLGHQGANFEIGSGTFLMVKPGAIGSAVDAVPEAEALSARLSIELESLRAEQRIASHQWPYLTGRQFRSRYVLAATWLDAPTVIEIGGFPNSLAEYVQNMHIVSVEPAMNDEDRDLSVERAKERGNTMSIIRAPVSSTRWEEFREPFDLVILGVDLSAEISEEAIGRALAVLWGLAARANRIIVEYSDYLPSRWVGEWLTDSLYFKRLADVGLDLRADPASREYCVDDYRGVRRMVVAERLVETPWLGPQADDLRRRVNAFRLHGNGCLILRAEEPVEFSSGSHCRQGLRYGFSFLEESQVWMIGAESGLQVMLPDGYDEGRLRLTLGGLPDRHCYPMDFKVMWNDGDVSVDGHLTCPGVVSVVLAFKGLSACAAGRIGLLRIVHPKFFTAKEVVGGADTRQLSMFLREVCFHGA